ncbi:tyrosine-type recombinase/integrase [Candidatus Bathyarchaeota archaeon]|nr:tyrosine-type recombinase/integrase [Candidatus Bathyarchaeota archaeon]
MGAIEEWMEELSNKARSTKERYLSFFIKFCNFLNKTPEEILQERKEDLKKGEERERRRYERELKRFIRFLEEKGYKRTSIQVAYASVRSFFDSHYVPLRMRRSDYPSGESLGYRSATKDDIRKLLERANIRQRALIMCLKDSGLRISDLLSLKYGNVREALERGEEFVPIRLVTQKNKISVTTFFGKEAVDSLVEYIELRKRGTKRVEGEGEINDEDPLFVVKGTKEKMTRSGASSSISLLIKRVGLEGQISAHSLRKFFQTQLENAGVPLNWIRIMIGHKLPGVESSYSRPSFEQLFRAYREAYPFLQVIPETPEGRLKKLEKELERLKREREIFEKNLLLLTSPENVKRLVLSSLRMTDPKKIRKILEEMKEGENSSYTDCDGNDSKYERKIVREEELINYPEWEIETTLPSGKIAIRKRIELIPIKRIF